MSFINPLLVSQLYYCLSPFTSTFDLIERFREGDETAFSQLFAKYRPRLGVLIRYKLGAVLRERVGALPASARGTRRLRPICGVRSRLFRRWMR